MSCGLILMGIWQKCGIIYVTLLWLNQLSRKKTVQYASLLPRVQVMMTKHSASEQRHLITDRGKHSRLTYDFSWHVLANVENFFCNVLLDWFVCTEGSQVCILWHLLHSLSANDVGIEGRTAQVRGHSRAWLLVITIRAHDADDCPFNFSGCLNGIFAGNPQNTTSVWATSSSIMWWAF